MCILAKIRDLNFDFSMQPLAAFPTGASHSSFFNKGQCRSLLFFFSFLATLRFLAFVLSPVSLLVPSGTTLVVVAVLDLPV